MGVRATHSDGRCLMSNGGRLLVATKVTDDGQPTSEDETAEETEDTSFE